MKMEIETPHPHSLTAFCGNGLEARHFGLPDVIFGCSATTHISSIDERDSPHETVLGFFVSRKKVVYIQL